MNDIRDLIPFSVFLDVVGAMVDCYRLIQEYRLYAIPRRSRLIDIGQIVHVKL
jgi:hypothetical protein